MSERPNISVIIPAYNREDMIGPAIESVLAQTLPAAEVLVVDDGSTDATAEVAARYGGRGVRCIRKDNGGASSARNRGVAEATGEWLAFLDSDDRWLPTMLARQAELLAGYPQAGLSFCDAAWYVDGDLAEPRTNWSERRATFAGALGVEPGCTGCFGADRFRRAQVKMGMICSPTQVLARRGLFEASGPFRSEYDPVEDYEMWLRGAETFDVCYLDEPLVEIHSHSGSLTRRPELAEKFHRHTRVVLTAALARERDPAIRDDIEHHLRRNWDSEIAGRIDAGDYEAASCCIEDAQRNGWRIDRHTGRPIKLAARFGPAAGALYRRLSGMLNRSA